MPQMKEDGRSIQRALEDGTLAPADALGPLADAAHEAKALGLRIAACRALGALSGRAYDASWDVAERAAFVLLEVARDADAPAERVALLHAMGRGFRNVWLMPYVHSRLSDDDATVVIAAISAAGGLAFPALEEMIASFLDEDVHEETRAAAIAALGRMGADSAAERLVPFVCEVPRHPRWAEASAALAALTEIRSVKGREAALEVLARDPPREVLLAAVRYLAEIGEVQVQRTLRSLARDEDAELRLAASIAARALEAERKRDADERILAALTERDRAVRAALARRLRTLPVVDVLAHAEVLLADDPLGVIQIVAEIRAPEVTRMLMRIAADDRVDPAVRARAAGSVEADEPWERDALVELSATSKDPSVRAAAAQTLGAFVPPAFVLDRLGGLIDDPSAAVRGALLWALQLSARPRDLQGKDRTRAEALVKRTLADPDVAVRRRAAYVAGNLDAAALVPDLVTLAREEIAHSDVRIAAFVALGDIASPARFADLVHLWNREDNPQALGAASRALERSLSQSDGTDDPPAPITPRTSRASKPPPLDSSSMPPSAPRSAPPSLARVHDRLPKLLVATDARVRAAAAQVAGLTLGAVPSDLLTKMVEDPSPRVREKAVVALGRVVGAAAEATLAEALDDADAAVQERAAETLLRIDTPTASARVIDFVSRTSDRSAALRVAKVLHPRRGGAGSGDDDAATQVALVGAALARVGPEDPIYEPLLALKLAILEAAQSAQQRMTAGSTTQKAGGVDESIAEAFPMWLRLRDVRGFAPLGRSLRTAEMLYLSSAGGSDADLSAAIVLWMKSLEGYLHAWLAPRLRTLQDRSSTLWELSDRLLGTAWPAYQRYLSERWPDPVKVGALSVEVPLRSAVNALRDLQEKRKRSLDSPMSVTEWSRIMLFLAIDHPSGPKNVLEIACRDADRAIKLAHKLQVLAQVRNVVTHRSTADASTLGEFRRAYYAAFEELTQMA